MKRYELLIVALLIPAFLAGCDKEESAPQTAPPTAVAKPPAQVVAPPAEAAPPEETRYVYVVEGRRDPFIPIVGKKTAATSENPLESFDLPQFQLKGLIIGFGEPKAIVAAPDGKSYILKKGTRIGKNNGIIREINRERILVEERYQDLSGATRSNIQEIKVPKREGV